MAAIALLIIAVLFLLALALGVISFLLRIIGTFIGSIIVVCGFFSDIKANRKYKKYGHY